MICTVLEPQDCGWVLLPPTLGDNRPRQGGKPPWSESWPCYLLPKPRGALPSRGMFSWKRRNMLLFPRSAGYPVEWSREELSPLLSLLLRTYLKALPALFLHQDFLLKIPRTEQEKCLVNDAGACPTPQGRGYRAGGPGERLLSDPVEQTAAGWEVCTHRVGLLHWPLTFSVFLKSLSQKDS